MTRDRSVLPATVGGRLLAAAILVASAARPVAAAPASESSRLVELLRLEPGMVAADVGAGEGGWTEPLARAVGPEGHVFSTEIEAEMVAELQARMKRAELTNVTAILGSQTDSGLPRACCDAILVRMVYHHFEDPPAMRASLRRALRPGGYLAVVDITPQKNWRRLDGVPDRGGHGIEPEQLVIELIAAGFEFVSRHDRWNGDEDRYCVVFRKGATAEPANN